MERVEAASLSSSRHIVGILNATPDSFSDGGNFLTPEDALSHVEKLIRDGAALIDIGADSTRPGSQCVGAEEEIRRLRPILSVLPQGTPFAVDTHHARTAAFALEHGAVMVNDVSAGSDPEMFSVLAGSGASLVLMFSRCQVPHEFGEDPPSDIIPVLKRFFRERAEQAERSGVHRSQLLFDPGMGAFVSSNPRTSWTIIEHFHELGALIREGDGRALYFGCSRKGFLRFAAEQSIEERDLTSALLGFAISERLPPHIPLYLRVHNAAIHSQFLFRGG
ncbi:dihydropteroate synthase [bacterium]|nr:dihydropteroate synthase [bacterium]